MLRLSRVRLENTNLHRGGRGAGTPAPQLPLLRQNLVRANFAALLKERTKNQRIFQGSERHLNLLSYPDKGAIINLKLVFIK